MKRFDTPSEIDASRVRRFLIARHGFDRNGTLDGICAALPGRFGCIQYDPLNVVGRNADLMLQSRVAGYRVGDLNGKMYRDRTLLDGWDKMMSVVHAEDWPRLKRIRDLKEAEYRGLLERRGADHALKHAEFALRELRDRGPLRSDALELGKVPAGGWGHRNAGSAVLEYLFMIGKVGVHEKKGTRKTFDLIERLLPERILGAPDPFPSDREFHKWLVLRRVRSVGVLWNKNGVLWQGIGPELANSSARASLFEDLTAEGSLKAFSVPGIARPLYAAGEEFAALEGTEPPAAKNPRGGLSGNRKQVRLLAPLDNLLWERELVSKIFGFDYSWEVYLPKAKRKYGYYVLPVLWGDELVARLEPVVSKDRGILTIERLWLEESLGAEDRPAFMRDLDAELQIFARYLGLEKAESASGAF